MTIDPLWPWFIPELPPFPPLPELPNPLYDWLRSQLDSATLPNPGLVPQVHIVPLSGALDVPRPVVELSSRGNRAGRHAWPAEDRAAIAKAVARHERKLRAAAELQAEEATKVAGEEIERANTAERLRASDKTKHSRAMSRAEAEWAEHIADYKRAVVTLTASNNRRIADADAQLNEMRRAMANAITDRDAVRKERDEAVATAERLRKSNDLYQEGVDRLAEHASSLRCCLDIADGHIRRYLSGDCRARTAMRELAALRGLSG